MREYYRHAREVSRCAKQQMESSEQMTERRSQPAVPRVAFAVYRMPISPYRASACSSARRNRSRAIRRWCCGCFEFVARHGIRLSLEAERRVRDHKLYLEEYFASSRPLWPSLRAMLLLPHAALALRAMHDTGLLQIIIPAWEQIECLVVRDFYHRYTVDEHTLVTVEYLEELRATRIPDAAISRASRRDARTSAAVPWRCCSTILGRATGSKGMRSHPRG